VRSARSILLGAALGSALAACGWIIGNDREIELRPDDGGGDDAGPAEDGPMEDARAGDAGDGGAVQDSGSEAARVDAGPITFKQVIAVNPGHAATASAKFDKDVLAHSAIIVAIDADGAPTMSSITDSLANTYQPVASPHDGLVGRLWMVYALDSKAGPCTITVTLAAAANSFLEVYAHEYSGIATANAFDVLRVADGTSGATDAVRSGTAPLGTNELLFAHVLSGTAVAGTGFTGRSNFDSNLTEDRIVAQAGTYEGIATMVGGAGWTMQMAAFRGN
jgi:hypothetical protein